MKGKVYKCSHFSCGEKRCSHIECTGGNGKKGKAISEGTCKKCGKGRYDEYTIDDFNKDEERKRLRAEQRERRKNFYQELAQERAAQSQVAEHNVENEKSEDKTDLSKKDLLVGIVFIVIVIIIVGLYHYFKG